MKTQTLLVPEKRTVTVPFSDATLEQRAGSDDGAMTLRGHAAVFDQLSEDLGGFREKIARGAFRSVLSDDVRLVFNHDENYVLGRTKSKTLLLQENPRGLAVESDVADTSYARDLKVLMDRGDVDQMSFMFTVARDRWEVTEDDENIRTILEFGRLYDVSVVTYPAYPQTDAKMRRIELTHGDGAVRAVEVAGETGEQAPASAPASDDDHEAREALHHKRQVEGTTRRLSLARANTPT